MDTQTSESTGQAQTGNPTTTDQGLQDKGQATTPNGGEEKPATYEVDGQNLTADEVLDSYKNLKGEFTRKSQRLKELETTVADPSKQLSDEQKGELEQVADMLAPLLKERGLGGDYITKKELRLQSLLSANPDLRSKEQEIKDLAALPANQGKPYEDIVQKYGFKSSNKLNKARMAGDPMGNSGYEQPAQKSISSMNAAEYENWKKEGGITGKVGFTNAAGA
jgi:hypothetical protein